MLGRKLSHYRIEEKLGEGGMGVVYRAWDERLNRPVALKVLHSAAPDETWARRVLKHEATALLRLSHPRVGTLLDFDHAEGVDFIVMEFVEGATLERQLTRGPLPQLEAIAIATQVAEAIEEAHEHGVIHRDLKPGNVMVTSPWQAGPRPGSVSRVAMDRGCSARCPTWHRSRSCRERPTHAATSSRSA